MKRRSHPNAKLRKYLRLYGAVERTQQVFSQFVSFNQTWDTRFSGASPLVACALIMRQRARLVARVRLPGGLARKFREMLEETSHKADAECPSAQELQR